MIGPIINDVNLKHAWYIFKLDTFNIYLYLAIHNIYTYRRGMTVERRYKNTR